MADDDAFEKGRQSFRAEQVQRQHEAEDRENAGAAAAAEVIPIIEPVLRPFKRHLTVEPGRSGGTAIYGGSGYSPWLTVYRSTTAGRFNVAVPRGLDESDEFHTELTRTELLVFLGRWVEERAPYWRKLDDEAAAAVKKPRWRLLLWIGIAVVALLIISAIGRR